MSSGRRRPACVDGGERDGGAAGDGWSWSSRELYAAFDVTLDESSSCPLADVRERILSIRRQVVADECHADVTVERSDGDGCDCQDVVHSTVEVEPDCFCTVFQSYGCVPRITGVTDDRIHVGAYLPDRTVLSDLVADLRANVADVHLRELQWVSETDDADPPEVASVDVADLTDEVRETAVRAVESGYYERPRETSFADLAADLDLEKSTLSERLNAVEARLVTGAFEETE